MASRLYQEFENGLDLACVPMLLHQRGGTMDSNGTAEVPLLRFYSTEFGEIWVEITQNVNSMGSMNFVKFRSESEL